MKISIEKLETGARNTFAFAATCNGVACGRIDASRTDLRGRVVYRVGRVDVVESARRKGVATKLYEAAAAEACARRGRLASTERLPDAASNEFWEKQLRKGRADAFPIRGAEARRYTRYVLKDCKQRDLSGLRR